MSWTLDGVGSHTGAEGYHAVQIESQLSPFAVDGGGFKQSVLLEHGNPLQRYPSLLPDRALTIGWPIRLFISPKSKRLQEMQATRVRRQKPAAREYTLRAAASSPVTDQRNQALQSSLKAGRQHRQAS